MDGVLFRNLIEVQPSSNRRSQESVLPLAKAVTEPAPAKPRTHHSAQSNADGIELQRPWTMSREPSGYGSRRDSAGGELGLSCPGTPPEDVVAAEVMPSATDPYMNRYRLLAVCMANFNNALNDGAAGALIPYMEKYYNIGYAVVSLIFVGQAFGFVFAAFVLDTLRSKLGRARLLGLAQTTMALAYIPLVCTAPFVVNVFAFFFVGFGLAVNVAMANIFCGSLQNSTVLLGVLHGSYGLGGTSGPLIATALVTVAHTVWSRYYLLTLCIGAAIAVLFTWSFWNYEKELSPIIREREAVPAGKSSLWSMASSLKLRVVLLGSIFIFAYQGSEVSISGWVISYLINARGGDPSSVGYVSSGFWAGITLGRFLLSSPAHRIGEKRFVYGVIVGAIAFQILVWFVPNIIGEAVAVSIVGLLLGPIYPCSAAVFMRAMTRRESLSGMGMISACGSLGGALAPFVTGLLAQVVGTQVLHPIAIFLFVVMLICWYFIPEEHKRSE